jgi:LuxR family maltose regulon positive regulatory protein
MPAIHAVALAHLGMARTRRGERSDGAAIVMQAVSELREHRLESYNLAAIVHCAHSFVAALQGDPDASRAAAERGNVIRAAMVHVVARAQIHTGLLLCEAAILRREPATAAEELETVRRHLAEEPDAVVLLTWAAELEARLAQQATGDVRAELTPAELRVLAQLPTHRSLVEIGEHLYVSRNTVKTHTLSIYRKLGVSGRSEAVERAAGLGLLQAG